MALRLDALGATEADKTGPRGFGHFVQLRKKSRGAEEMSGSVLSGGGVTGTYASKKRKKPVQKIPKPPPPEGAKSNPSKRHRDRLNMELDKLTSLLPFSEDVRSRLDKLSVLRLSVGYLKVKSFFNATIKKNISGANGWPAGISGGNGQTVNGLDGINYPEGELLLQALNGFVLVVTAEGYVFYSSPTIQDYLGFHQSDVVHQSVFELIHTDDRLMFRRQLHFALNPTQCELSDDPDGLQKTAQITSSLINYNPKQLPPENSSFLERSFCCRFRCLLDNSSGFLALNFQGRLKYLHGQNKLAEDGTIAHPQLALFAIVTPLQPPSIMEIRCKTLLFQTKHKLDFTPLGVDTRGKVVLGYTEMELCTRGSGYQFIHAADMMHCADNHLRMIKTGESGFTVFRLLSKSGTWIWVQANARLVYKGGRPEFIIARQRALTYDEGEEHLRQRKLQLPFSFATGEAVLYETTSSPDVTEIPNQIKEGKISKPAALPPSSISTCMLKQDQSVYPPKNDPNSQFCLEKAFCDSHALLNVPGKPWTGVGGPFEIKEESQVREMIDSLQQIIGDTTMCDTLKDLEIDQQDLKDWESTLLRMNTLSNAELPVEISDTIANDIFSYVEEMLFSDRSSSLNEQLPQCLSELQLQGDLQDIMEGIETGSLATGVINLLHVNREVPLGQRGSPPEAFVDSIDACDNMMEFNSLHPGQQNQVRLLQQRTSVQQTQAELRPRAQTENPVYSENVTLPNFPNQAQQLAFQNHQHHTISQISQWMDSQTSNSKNVLLSGTGMLNPNVCIKGQFPLCNQSMENSSLNQTWHSSPPSVQLDMNRFPSISNIPNVQNIPNGHHIVGGQPNNIQQDPLTGLMLQSNCSSGPPLSQPVGNTVYNKQSELLKLSNSVYRQQGEHMHSSNAMFGPHGELLQPSNLMCDQQKERSHPSNTVFEQQGKLMDSCTFGPVTSCMFERGKQPPVSGILYNSGPPKASVRSQKANAFQAQTEMQGICFYQNGPADHIINNQAMPQDGALTHILQQQFLSCNKQTQLANHPVQETGPYHFPPLALEGQTCFTNTSQNKNF